MRVLITGATGYIGSYVARRLDAGGHAIIAAVRDESRTGALKALHRQPEILVASLNDLDRLGEAARRADAVMHIAFDHKPESLQDSIQQELAVLRTFFDALDGSGKTLIGTTATGLLGDTGPEPVDEDHPSAPGFIGVSRREVERQLVDAAARNIRTIVIRPSILTHSHKLGGVIPRLMAAAKRDGVSRYIGSGDNRVTSVHVDDLAALYLLAVNSEVSGRIYNGAGSDAAMFDVAGQIGRTLSVPVKSVTIDEAQASWGRFYAALLSMNNRVSHARASNELGWAPYTVAPSIQQDIARLAESGLI